ncbi:MAG: MFS transporter [Chloroflexi bacterium]|nr:MFS transporter [Chloroflexota bacterium]
MASSDLVKPDASAVAAAGVQQVTAAAPPSWLGWAGYPWVVLFASSLVQTSASFGNQSISPLAPFLVADLGLSKANIGSLVTATYIGATLVLVLAGSLSDRFGVRALFLIGMAMAGIPLAAASVAPSYLWLLVPMALYAVGNGFSLPPTTRAIVEWFPTNRRGVAMGVKQTGVALAGMICGLAVPPLGQAIGWRGTILVLGVMTVLSGVLAWVLFRDRPDDPSAGPKPPRPGFLTVARNRSLLLLSGVTFLYAGVQLSLAGFMVLFLTEKVGMGVTEAGAMLALAQAGGIVGRIGWGIVSDVLFGGRRKIVMAIFSVMAAVSSVVLSLTGPDTPRIVLLVTLAVAGVSAIGWNGINMLFVAEIAGRQASATAAGFNLTASYLGIMVGPPIFGILVDMTGAYTTAFQVGAAASLASLCLLALIKAPEHAENRG